MSERKVWTVRCGTVSIIVSAETAEEAIEIAKRNNRPFKLPKVDKVHDKLCGLEADNVWYDEDPT